MFEDISKGLTVGSALGELFAPNVDYSILKLEGEYLDQQAQALDLKVEQQADALREQFASQVGSYTYGAAQRGVKIDEGNVAQNIEKSGINIGEDIQTARKNVQYKKRSIRGKKKLLDLASDNEANILGIPTRNLMRSASTISGSKLLSRGNY